MAGTKTIDNKPLARAAIGFLFGAVLVLMVILLVVFYRDIADFFFSHRVLFHAGMIGMLVLFAGLSLTSSALGFLSESSTGRRTAYLGILLFVAGMILAIVPYVGIVRG